VLIGRWIFVMLAVAALGAACTPDVKPPPPAADTYVALGDSFTAGTLIPNQNQTPSGCLRSDRNFPHLAAPSTGLPKLVDVSCSGATTDNMTHAQTLPVGSPGTNAPQFGALDFMTGVVTITIGGNDVGYWSTITDMCTSATGNGTPCQDQFVVNGVDTVSQSIAAAAPKVAAVLDGIHQRATRAAVYVVAYEAIFPELGLEGGSEGCFPQLPFTPGDVPYLRAKQQEINAMIRQQAAAHNATFVDAYGASVGHDACQPSAARWVEPATMPGVAYKLHPNQAGMTGAKDALVAAL
jgi:lysophospholipase L1-like esterase